ncbi:MAG: hypothetical protein HY376_04070 [Candidatus Blackburnbacteria bacterium]|nr:hypothetical protein [Candidatus Blackburnbacteria bacterium]
MTKKTLNSLWTSALALALSATPVAAQDAAKINIGTGAPSTTVANLTIGAIVSTAIKILVVVAAVLFFFWLVLGGIKWITSGGDKNKTEEARQQITSALVGLVVVFSAWAIAQLIKILFDVDLFNLTIERVGV